MNQIEDKTKFCIRYLIDKGIEPDIYQALYNGIIEPKLSYAIITLDEDFFTKAAQGLWNLWPRGKKDGKFDWKESVPVLRDRLMFIWKEEKITDNYTVDDILEAGRKYTAQFEHASTKFMQLLKYFIFKQKPIGVNEKGLIKMSYESTLVKMLQDKKHEEKQESFEDFVI